MAAMENAEECGGLCLHRRSQFATEGEDVVEADERAGSGQRTKNEMDMVEVAIRIKAVVGRKAKA